MNPSIVSEPIAVTPLTPIHIGCGIDFDPTNYVIDDNTLFHFDPARVPLDEQDRAALMAAVSAPGDQGLMRVQSFFHTRRELFIGAARGVVPVAPGVSLLYTERIGRHAHVESQGRGVVNALVIERTAHHPHSDRAYVPGSSLKGAMRTAWLNAINSGASHHAGKAADLEQQLLRSEPGFHTDPFRLVRIADAIDDDVETRVVLSVNRKKRLVLDAQGTEASGKGPPVRREAIVPGRVRGLRSDIRIDSLGGIVDPAGAMVRDRRTPQSDRRIADVAALARACNAYYRPRLDATLRLLAERRFSDDPWIRDMTRLIEALAPALDAGRAMLLRVGRHSGAENVTLDGVRSIRIMGGKGQPSRQGDESTTVWLAAEHERDRSCMQPFGWVLVERACDPVAPALAEWAAGRARASVVAARERVARARRDLERAAEERARRQQEQAAREQAERADRELRAQRVAALSENGRRVERLRESLAAHDGRPQPVGGALFAAMQGLLKAALEEGWSTEDRGALADLIAGIGAEKVDFGGRAKEMKRAVRNLRGES